MKNLATPTTNAGLPAIVCLTTPSDVAARRRRRAGAEILLAESWAQEAAAVGLTARDLIPDAATRAAVSPLARDELSRLQRHAYLPV